MEDEPKIRIKMPAPPSIKNAKENRSLCPKGSFDLSNNLKINTNKLPIYIKKNLKKYRSLISH